MIASWKEPFPGWIDNFNGPVGLCVAFGTGLMKTVICHNEAIPDYVPVDIVAKTTIIAAWKTAVLR